MTHPTSARLSFQRPRAVDLDDSAAMWGDPVVTRHIGGKPFSRQDTWAKVLRNIGHWEAMGYGYWVVRETASGRFVGEVGFANFKREIDPPMEVPETGWVLAPWCYGQGFATEAVRAALAWGDAKFPRTACIIDVGNAASIRVAEKSGYKESRRTDYKGEPVIWFEREVL